MEEIDKILRDLPMFKFAFPDMSTIRRLDAENSRRRKAVASAMKTVSEIIDLDPAALAALGDETLEKLLRRIKEARSESD